MSSTTATDGSRGSPRPAGVGGVGWWLDTLGEGAAKLAQSLRGQASTEVVVRRGEDALQLEARAPGHETRHARISLDFTDEALAEELESHLKRIAGKRYRITARLPRSAVLVREIALPRAAETSLRAVVSHQIDRVTPWTADNCFFDAIIAEAPTESSQVKAKVIAAPKDKVLELVQWLGRLGVRPEAVDCEDDGLADLREDHPPINLLPHVDNRGGGRARRIVRLFLMGLVLAYLAVLAILAVEGWERSARIDTLAAEAETEGLRVEAVERLRGDIESLQEDRRFLAERRREIPSLTIVLEAASRLLPPSVWLTEMTVEDRQLEMIGFAPDASALIAVLEDSAHFSDVGFASPIRRDPERAADRFHITARIEPNFEVTP